MEAFSSPPTTKTFMGPSIILKKPARGEISRKIIMVTEGKRHKKWRATHFGTKFISLDIGTRGKHRFEKRIFFFFFLALIL
jgi:hypothetical protein